MDGSGWTPRDHAELVAGWRLWLELSSGVHPGPDWDGSAAAAVARLRDLVGLCDAIQAEYVAASDDPNGTILAMLRLVVFLASSSIENWWDDDLEFWSGTARPLDTERLTLLHADLAAFSERLAVFRTALAEGGGWRGIEPAFPSA
ncbi:hypothetical protein [Amycolatopsis sp. CA-230715]|uniref:hypothetical protein n=1 Tax=Amycolatopsis sp. CA-230715 TaxID=2745196 RepID=UPI001C027EAF|nr:hypothetical protein [Amycolatopsis sp. CA-230715]QWF79591.1 hypothetical protein HUW46_03000 [Amycolatopsis sp. CA-230715]